MTLSDSAQSPDNNYDFDQFAYAYPQLALSALLKQQPSDFIVEEQLGYDLNGQGEHLWLYIEKIQQNTDWVARQLASWLNTSAVNVGYAGQKDRQAITRQWFSVPCGVNQQLDLDAFNIEGVKILDSKRHDKKLRRGELSANHFQITLRQLQTAEDVPIESIKELVEQRLQVIQQGVPNYYGSQRFGKNSNNLKQGESLLAPRNDSKAKKGRRRNPRAGRNQNSLAISAIRSWMFNDLLSLRVKANNWQNPIDGDWVFNGLENDYQMFDQTSSSQTNLWVQGAVFGDGALLTQGEAKSIEEQVIAKYPLWYQGLCQNRVKPAERSFVLKPQALQWTWSRVNQSSDNQLDLELQFSLPKGCFATVLLRELCELR